jgi:predicted TPR repeat methyltransferase
VTRGSLPASYFDALYAKDPDPWRFASSEYERAKYAATLQALPRARYVSAFEVGCSIGVLTHQLAERCDSLLSVDAAGAPLQKARERCRDRPAVRFAKMTVPQDWPAETFDLILLSEVIYYLDKGDISRLACRVDSSLGRGGDLVLVHWLGETDYPLSGEEAAELFIDEVRPFASLARQFRADRYRLDVVTRK